MPLSSASVYDHTFFVVMPVHALEAMKSAPMTGICAGFENRNWNWLSESRAYPSFRLVWTISTLRVRAEALLVNTYGPGGAFDFLSRAPAKVVIARIRISTRFILLPHCDFSVIAPRTANYRSHLNNSTALMLIENGFFLVGRALQARSSGGVKG